MSFIRIIIIPTIFGLLGGVLGAFFITRLFSEQVAPSPFEAPLITRVSSPNLEEQIKITEAKKSLVFFYPASNKGPLMPAEAAALGLALTTDGLIVSPDYVKNPPNFLAVSAETKPFRVEFAKDKHGAIFSNSESGLTFYKIKPDPNEMPRIRPVGLCHFEDIYVGQTVFSFDSTARGAVLRRILSVGSPPALPNVPSALDALTGLLTIDDDLKAGTFIFGASGCLVGVASQDKAIFPAEFLDNMTRGYLKDGIYAKTKLGAHAVNLSQFAAVPNGFPAAGLWVQKPKGRPAVAPDSAAEKAGIKQGDILVSFDGQRLDQSFPFPLLLQRYLPGTEVEIEILREGKELKIKVVLMGE